MKKILVLLVLIVLTSALVIPAAAGNGMGGGGNGGGNGTAENGKGNGSGEGETYGTAGQYGPGEGQTFGTAGQYGPGEGQTFGTAGQYGPGPQSTDCTPQPGNSFGNGSGADSPVENKYGYSTGPFDVTGQGQQGPLNGFANKFNALEPPSYDSSLDANETNALLVMREEEKLAHDVYVTLYVQWELPIFQNISQSEQTHTDAIKALIDRYGLQDPAMNGVGFFTNPDLQALYNTLIARGSQSLSEALMVGAAIEEIDILDLEEYLSQVDNADIQQVFTNLKSGSYNHLKAFTSTLYTQTGEIYQPQYLSVSAYQAILATGTGGNGYNGPEDGNWSGRP
jgi:hypothetical protein